MHLWSSPPSTSCTIWKADFLEFLEKFKKKFKKKILIFLKIFHLIMGSPVTSVGYWHSDKYWFCVLFFLVQILSYSWFQSAHVNHWVPSGGKGTHTVWSRLSWFTFICSQSYTIVFSESESCSVVMRYPPWAQNWGGGMQKNSVINIVL